MARRHTTGARVVDLTAKNWQNCRERRSRRTNFSASVGDHCHGRTQGGNNRLELDTEQACARLADLESRQLVTHPQEAVDFRVVPRQSASRPITAQETSIASFVDALFRLLPLRRPVNGSTDCVVVFALIPALVAQPPVGGLVVPFANAEAHEHASLERDAARMLLLGLTRTGDAASAAAYRAFRSMEITPSRKWVGDATPEPWPKKGARIRPSATSRRTTCSRNARGLTTPLRQRVAWGLHA